VIATYAVPEIKLDNCCNLFNNMSTYETSNNNNEMINDPGSNATENCFSPSICDKSNINFSFFLKLLFTF